ncbi:hypothetical protein [Arvimicrobium flavum]|uniref:hypothetical protein n=1 Tax=Arvimicrobium flavum TaxID=3393320 RepID=UPI00237B8BA7|nr:hypothetical protein [Mesorhizobium shangrilense]
MNAKLIAATLLLAMAGAAHAQEVLTPAPRLICPDGSDPLITGTCTPLKFRNAIDEGRATSVLPPAPPVFVPNDPLGSAVGNSPPDIGGMSGFGNSAIQLPKLK